MIQELLLIICPNIQFGTSLDKRYWKSGDKIFFIGSTLFKSIFVGAILEMVERNI
jgi:hypothetical protein